MTAARYAPGAFPAALTGRGAVVVSAEAPIDLLTAAWERMRAGSSIADIIEALAADRPASALPGFVVVLAETTGWRIAARGTFSVHAGDASVDISAEAPWAEHRVGDDVTVTVAAGGATVTGSALPLVDGVAMIAAVAVSHASASPPASVAADVAAPVEPVQPHTLAEVHDEPAPAEPETVDPTPEPPADAPEPAPADAPTGITDSIPEHLRPRPSVPAAPPVPPPPPAPPATDADVLGDVEATAVRGAASAPEEVDETVIRDRPAPPEQVVGDHDGETISLEEARRLRAEGQLPPASTPTAAAAAPPAAGRAVLSTGQVVVLDRILVVGRRPRSTRASGTMPHLVAVDSPQQDISRNHLEVRPEGDTLLATDLNTTNGTTLRRPGAQPVKLHPSEPTVVVPGDVLDLGEGITVTLEAPA